MPGYKDNLGRKRRERKREFGWFVRWETTVYVEKFALLSNLIPSSLINLYSVSQLRLSKYEFRFQVKNSNGRGVTFSVVTKLWDKL